MMTRDFVFMTWGKLSAAQRAWLVAVLVSDLIIAAALIWFANETRYCRQHHSEVVKGGR